MSFEFGERFAFRIEYLGTSVWLDSVWLLILPYEAQPEISVNSSNGNSSRIIERRWRIVCGGV